MKRDNTYSQRDPCNLNYRLYGAKGERSPWSWVYRLMMPSMNKKKFFMMHHPMREIEIGIMENDKRQCTKYKIDCTIGGEVLIDHRVAIHP